MTKDSITAGQIAQLALAGAPRANSAPSSASHSASVNRRAADPPD
jgi:hypothetical protein